MNYSIPKAWSLLFVLTGSLLFSNVAFSRTEVTGTITKNTKWTLDQSPYLLSGDITVDERAFLSVERNVIVILKKGARFQIKGRLDAYRAFFNGYFDTNNKEVFHYFPDSHGSLIRCSFLDLSLVFDSSSIRLASSVVSNRNGTGVTIGKDAFPSVVDTNFHGNSYFAVYHMGNTPIRVTNCFWGSKRGPSGKGDGDGDAVGDHIFFSPFRTKETSSFLILYEVVFQTSGDPAGNDIEIAYHLYNMNQTELEVVLGASLHGEGNRVYHHPESDILTTLPAGFHTYNRLFEIPPHAHDGRYDAHCSVMNKNMNTYHAYSKDKGGIMILNSSLNTKHGLTRIVDLEE